MLTSNRHWLLAVFLMLKVRIFSSVDGSQYSILPFTDFERTLPLAKRMQSKKSNKRRKKGRLNIQMFPCHDFENFGKQDLLPILAVWSPD